MCGILSDRSNSEHIITINPDARNPITIGPASQVRDRSRSCKRTVFTVVVVLHNHEHRKLPNGREIQRLVERSYIGRSITCECSCNSGSIEVLRSEACTHSDGYLCTNYCVGPERTNAEVSEMHRASLATTQPALFTQNFRESIRHGSTHR